MLYKFFGSSQKAVFSSIIDLIYSLNNSNDINAFIGKLLEFFKKFLDADSALCLFKIKTHCFFKIDSIECPSNQIPTKINDKDLLDIFSFILNSIKNQNEPIIFNNFQIKKLLIQIMPLNTLAMSQIVLPIFVQNNLCIVLIIENKRNVSFTKFESNCFKLVAAISSSIYQRISESIDKDSEFEFLEQMSKISSDKLDNIINKSLQNLSKFLNSKFVSLWLYNELDDTLVIRAYYPTEIGNSTINYSDLDTRVLRISQCLSGMAIREKKEIYIKDVFKEGSFKNRSFSRKHSLKQLLSVPIQFGDSILGVINIWWGEHDNSESYLSTRLIASFASALAIRIRLCQIQDIEEFVFAYDEIFSKMLDISDEQASWDRVAAIVSEQMHSEACSIFFVSSDGRLYLKGSTGIEGNHLYKDVFYNINEGLTGYAFQNKDTLVYYKELKEDFKDIHIGKFNENLKSSKENKSIIFSTIYDSHDIKCGIIRCNNRIETPQRRSGRFSKDDSFKLKFIGKTIFSGYSKVLFSKEKEFERERNLNSLHHEIIAPIDGILSHIEWMEDFISPVGINDPATMEKAKIKYEDMKQSSKLIEMLVTTIGRFDDITLNYESIQFHEILQIAKSFLINEAKRESVQIFIDFLAIPKGVGGDKNQLLRVFYNLFRNAIKYSDKKEVKRYIRVFASSDNRFVQLKFEDNGIGINEKEKEIIFNKFVRGSNANAVFPQGTGLGLAYCRAIISKHKGNIFVDQQNCKKPTIFVINFPLDQRYKK